MVKKYKRKTVKKRNEEVRKANEHVKRHRNIIQAAQFFSIQQTILRDRQSGKSTGEKQGIQQHCPLHMRKTL